MGKISFRNNGEDHNFWQNYTDLMSGFLIVFIIASIVAYSSYKIYVDLYHEKGITEANMSVLRSGKAKGVRFHTLNRICFFLNCSVGDILFFDGELDEEDSDEES